MANLRQLLDKLPIDDEILRRVPVPGLQGDCILEIDATRGVRDAAPTSPLEAIQMRNTPTLGDVVDGLRRGATDDKVKGLIAHTAGSALTLAQADELRAAVEAFRESGKPCVAWSESFGEFGPGMAQYVLASAFDEIWLQPTGDLAFFGARMTGLFVREALDKLGVVPQFAGRKEFKSAGDMFTEKGFTEPNREQLQAIVDSVVAAVAEQVASARGLSEEAVRAAVDSAPLTPEAALERGFIDRVGYRDEAHASIRARIGDSTDRPAQLRFVERYGHKSSVPGAPKVPSLRRGKPPVIGVIHAQGPIHLGRSSGQSPLAGTSIGSDSLGAALRHAVKEEVAAVVLRVNSGGGSAVASDAIRREMLQVRDAGIPVVASMGDVAASGGYYIAMPATEVVAGPHTVTGSIGVIAGKLVTSGAWSRIGVQSDTVSHGRFAQFFSSAKQFDDEEWAVLNDILDRVYDDFVTRAAEDRGMPLDELEPLAHGRVWTGRDAHERGLVDHLGGLSTAIDRACILLGVRRDAAVVQEMPKLSPLDRFLPTDNSDAPSAGAVFGEGVDVVDRALAKLGLTSTGLLTAPWVPKLR
ncbi:MAG: signal peptide peptidase SppA [Dermatophilus congolensis]|nr:signal peptide peptidase SppA [Dermatophilus congolensis]